MSLRASIRNRHRTLGRPWMTAATSLLVLMSALSTANAYGVAPSLPSIQEAMKRDADWWAGEEAWTLCERVMAWQSDVGAWPKGWPRDRDPRDNDGESGKSDRRRGERAIDTIDNRATIGELRLLAHALHIRTSIEGEAPRVAQLKAALRRGLDALLNAQYPSGGWPQQFPVDRLKPNDYARHITFNDDAMTRVLEWLLELNISDAGKTWLDDAQRTRVADALRRGIDCVLATQVRVEDELTVWCAQHDAETLEPTWARSYEPPSLSGSESAGVVMFLMSLPDPDERVKRSIRSAVRWFEQTREPGFRIEVQDVERLDNSGALVRERRRVKVADPSAKGLWARFYELQTNRPIFLNRDGVVRYRFEEVDLDRNMGYAYWSDRGLRVLTMFQDWSTRHPEPQD